MPPGLQTWTDCAARPPSQFSIWGATVCFISVQWILTIV
eukprot:COSAG02_NODE_66531_length_255_cov_0.660256_1_plen_38_part_10